ncbi:cobalt transporter CbiM [Thiorhodospira sibirica]|uniref:cobalt transporter CbiM n=1 Tax=Thiorhodospira sibirica TaxID=154347 RepID=UPI00022C4C74|nr:cobalt transporter CbiM [Thiorhodospira sibirica]
MHIVDGVVTHEVLIAGSLLAIAGIAIGLHRLTLENIPAAGVISAVFFIASLIHVPLGPSSVHLLMNGLAGLILGFAAFPALFIALLLQAVFLGFGGITVLGINTLSVALPAVLLHYLCIHGVRHPDIRIAAVWGAIAGGGAILLTALSIALVLMLSGEAFFMIAKFAIIAHLPVMIIEGLLCAVAVILIKKVKPDIFARTFWKNTTP